MIKPLVKENCLTVRDLLQALSSNAVNPDMLITHSTVHGEGNYLSKISGIAVHPGGAVVLWTNENEGTVNEDDDEVEWLDLL